MGASDSQFLFKISGTKAETRVVEFDALEAISCTYEVNLTIAVKKTSKITFDEVAGYEAVLTIISGMPAPYDIKTHKLLDINRYFHGIISKFEYAGHHGDFNIFHTRLVPSLWLLSLDVNGKVKVYQFRELKSVPANWLENGFSQVERVESHLLSGRVVLQRHGPEVDSYAPLC